jgi:hypothetical protein
MPTIDLNFKNELYANCERMAQKLQFWRLCESGKCRRSRHCHNWQRCVLRVGEWYGAIKDAAERERRANDPVHRAMVEDMVERVRRLSRTMQAESEREYEAARSPGEIVSPEENARP